MLFFLEKSVQGRKEPGNYLTVNLSHTDKLLVNNKNHFLSHLIYLVFSFLCFYGIHLPCTVQNKFV